MLRIIFTSVVVCVLTSCAGGPKTKPVTTELSVSPKPIYQKSLEVTSQNLERAEVIAHIDGNTEAWTKGGGYYSPGGQLDVLWNGKDSVGTWEVSDDGKVCYVVEIWGPDKECHHYIREAGQTKLLYDGKARVAEIRPGNQLNSISY